MQIMQDMWTSFIFLAPENDMKIYFHGNGFFIFIKYYRRENI